MAMLVSALLHVSHFSFLGHMLHLRRKRPGVAGVLEVFRKALERLDQQATNHAPSDQQATNHALSALARLDQQATSDQVSHQVSHQATSHQAPSAPLLCQVLAHRQDKQGVGDAFLQPPSRLLSTRAL
jgi:hypothetical protein